MRGWIDVDIRSEMVETGMFGKDPPGGGGKGKGGNGVRIGCLGGV